MDVLSLCWRGSRRHARRDLREGLGKSSEGESRGRRADWPCHIKTPEGILLRPSVQLPAGIHGWPRYKHFGRAGKGKPPHSHPQGQQQIKPLCLTGKAPAVSFGGLAGASLGLAGHADFEFSRKILKNKYIPRCPPLDGPRRSVRGHV